MALSVRYFVFEENGDLKAMSKDLVSDLGAGQDRLTDYAGQSIRMVEVVLVNADGKPDRIHSANGSIWYFDAEGRIDESRDDRVRALMSAALADKIFGSGEDDNVVDLSRRIDQRRFEMEFSWEPTPKDITKIVEAIWPGTTGLSMDRPRYLKGKKKRRARMTFPAKMAHDEIQKQVWDITRSFEELGDKDLKALIDKLQQHLKIIPTHQGARIWMGIVEQVEHHQKIRKAHQVKKGKWFAVASAIAWGPDIWPRSSGEGRTLETVECKGRDEAVAVGRELLRKHADQFTIDTEVEVELIPEILHNPPPVEID